MKKLLLGLGAATAVIAPIAAVVACGSTDTKGTDSKGTNTETDIKDLQGITFNWARDVQDQATHSIFPITKNMLTKPANALSGKTLILHINGSNYTVVMDPAISRVRAGNGIQPNGIEAIGMGLSMAFTQHITPKTRREVIRQVAGAAVKLSGGEVNFAKHASLLAKMWIGGNKFVFIFSFNFRV